jgi:hypothetical protein
MSFFKSDNTLSANISNVNLILLSIAASAVAIGTLLYEKQSSTQLDHDTYIDSITIYAANFYIHKLNSSYCSFLSIRSTSITAFSK